MTIDDENSVYVGGLPYDATEDSIRKAFDFYGRVVAVKIVNDRAVGGKCYGFVTFTNPRSAINAISDMDGKRIDGRVVKVNEVKTRSGMSNFGRDRFRRNSERGMDWDRGRDRERDYDRDRYRDRHRERSLDRDEDREKEYDRTRDHDRTRGHFVDRDRGQDQDRDMKDIEPEHDRNRDLDRDLNSDQDQEREFDRTKSHHRSGEKDKDQISKSLNGSDANDRHSRELSSESSDGDNDQYQVDKQLDISTQKLGELQKEILKMEELLEEKREVISKLQEKSQNLEDALSMAKNLTSHRQMQLTKLHKCYLRMKEYSERLKNSEQELQSLVDTTMIEIEYGDDVGVRNGVLSNGNAQHHQ